MAAKSGPSAGPAPVGLAAGAKEDAAAGGSSAPAAANRFVSTRCLDPESIHKFPDNTVRNTKYTVWNFVFKNLMLQFGHHINRYFLLIAVLQLYPPITPVSPVTTWGPLLLIFTISAVKEAFDDVNRSKEDSRFNRAERFVVLNGERLAVPSQDIRTGELVYVYEDDDVPCDLVLLQSSAPDGECYIQTSNIDGETNLKSRTALQQTQGLEETVLHSIRAQVECPPPDPHLYDFAARLTVHRGDASGASGAPSSHPLGVSQLIPQATVLRNTEWVLGMAVYTGDQTKLGQNKSIAPDKWTVIDEKINQATVFIFVGMVGLVAVFGTIGNFVWPGNFNPDYWYLNFAEDEPAAKLLLIYLRFFLLCSLMIPISLKVTMDFAKLYYALCINWDREMYHADSDTPARATNTSISEDLGQVEYVLTDKTGTLTENIMVFKKVAIGLGRFGEQGDVFADPALLAECREACDVGTLRNTHDHMAQFWRCLALCHTVVPSSRSRDGREVIHYASSSPDEEALVDTARSFGFRLRSRDQTHVTIDLLPGGADGAVAGVETYEVLATLEFDSDRKRMSVLLRAEDGSLHLYCKGADSVVAELVKDRGDEVMASCKLALDAYSSQGLRTLLVAYRPVSQAEWAEWQPVFKAASEQVGDKARKAALAAAYESMEHSLLLMGATGIEDRLQEDVPETIAALRAAGINVWMLTGDKFQTAKEIAFSCNLATASARLTELHQPMPVVTIQRRLEELLHQLKTSERRDTAVSGGDVRLEQMGPSIEDYGLVIDGVSLQLCLASHYELFGEVATRCHAVVCCRLTPSQKAELVSLLAKWGKGNVTLAIGDGGNDVGMIQAARIGVGIAGREGLQAARAADYSIARFKYLKRLIFVHGRYSHERTAFIAQYCFYKSLFISFLQLGFAYFSAWSGASFFDSYSIMSYNIFYTSAPVLLFVLEQDLSPETLMRKPKLYGKSQKGTAFTVTTIAGWFGLSMLQCVLIGISVFFSAREGGGRDFVLGQFADSFTAYAACVFVVNFTLMVYTTHFTRINLVVFALTLVAFFLFNMVLGALPSIEETYGLPISLFGDGLFWMVLFHTTVVALLPVFCGKVYKRLWSPNATEVTREEEILLRRSVASDSGESV